MYLYRIEPDLLPEEVMDAAAELHAALIMCTDYDGVQVTFTIDRTNVYSNTDNTATFDVQVKETD